MSVTLLYRGALASCNYDCSYCPFAKHASDFEELARDRSELRRFIDWVAEHPEPTSILFTPWGEGLVRRWYQSALVRLSHLPHVERVAIQTNLACRLDWLRQAELSRVALWASFHPSQIELGLFLRRCRQLDSLGVRYSVGIVGLPQHLEVAHRLRDGLRDEVYLWVNAYKSRGAQPSAEREAAGFARIDPLYPLSAQRHRSRGLGCRTGSSVFSVDGSGSVRRCHFVDEPLGNLYDGGLAPLSAERPCPNETCSCHIGYVHLDALDLYPVFDGGLLERIPAQWPVAQPDDADAYRLPVPRRRAPPEVTP